MAQIPSSPLCNRLYIHYLLFVCVLLAFVPVERFIFCLGRGPRLLSLQFFVVWAKNALLMVLLVHSLLSPFRWPGFEAQGHIHFRVKDWKRDARGCVRSLRHTVRLMLMRACPERKNERTARHFYCSLFHPPLPSHSLSLSLFFSFLSPLSIFRDAHAFGPAPAILPFLFPYSLLSFNRVAYFSVCLEWSMTCWHSCKKPHLCVGPAIRSGMFSCTPLSLAASYSDSHSLYFFSFFSSWEFRRFLALPFLPFTFSFLCLYWPLDNFCILLFHRNERMA